MRLIQDLFPNFANSTPKTVDETLKANAKLVCPKRNLQPDEAFIGKRLYNFKS